MISFLTGRYDSGTTDSARHNRLDHCKGREFILSLHLRISKREQSNGKETCTEARGDFVVKHEDGVDFPQGTKPTYNEHFKQVTGALVSENAARSPVAFNSPCDDAVSVDACTRARPN